MVVLNSYSAAYDLLSRRSAIYSSRPRLVMAGELYEAFHSLLGFHNSCYYMLIFHLWFFSIGANRTTAFIPYGLKWRSQRRVWQQHLNVRALSGYRGHISTEVQAFVKRVLVDSTDIHSQIRLYVETSSFIQDYASSVQSLMRLWSSA